MPATKRDSLADVAVRLGASLPCTGNLPVALDDPQSVWFVEEGAVDLFLIEDQDEAVPSAPRHLLRADAGRLLLGIEPRTGGTSFSLIAKGLPDTVLRHLPVAELAAVGHVEVAQHVDEWIVDVSASMSRDIVLWPRPDVLAMPGHGLPETDGVLSVRGGVVWVSEPPAGAGLFLGLVDPTEHRPEGSETAGMIPLTPASWLTLVEAAQLSSRSSDTLSQEGLLFLSLQRFHAMAFSLEQLNRSIEAADQANLERDRTADRHRDEKHARFRLFNLYGLPAADDASEGAAPLFKALQILGRHEGIKFRLPAGTDPTDSALGVRDILDASGVRGRQVRLARKKRWWTDDHGTMLAFREADGHPIVLLPSIFGGYREIDPSGRRRARVTAERAALLRADAWLFYPTLPAGKIGWQDLFRVAKRGLVADFVRFAVTGLLGSLLLLLPAVVVGFVVDEAILVGDLGLLHATAALLAMFALLWALLYMLQGMALMRLEGRAVYRVEAAFWDRMLRLPLSVLRRYPSGNLALRGMMFQTLRDAVRTVIADAVLSAVFLLPAFFLIYLYDATLAIVTGVFGLLSLLVTVLLGVQQIAPHGRQVRAVHRLAGRLFQAISGIATLRVANAEGTAFAKLAEDYRRKKRAELKIGAFEEHSKALGTALPLLAGAVLLLAAALPGREPLAVGTFLVIYFAFMAFQTAVARLGTSFGAVAAIRPAFDQIRPLFAEQAESDAEGEPVGELDGEVVFDHVTFRYAPDAPLILDDVTIRANPGEFIAIAGESGAGKSTLFRLALGMGQPTTGNVYYDRRDLRHINIKQLRRKIGVVPQDVSLHLQDIWDNIAASDGEVLAEDVWQAAETASVAADIRAMPMQLLTNVGTSASIVSGGESQRIMIARALLRKPRILLLDEATNWLDNKNQANIMATLARLPVTRIVIAHRLSTLRLADRIYVLQSGKVVQEGSFVGLMGCEGVFRELAHRQMA